MHALFAAQKHTCAIMLHIQSRLCLKSLCCNDVHLCCRWCTLTHSAARLTRARAASVSPPPTSSCSSTCCALPSTWRCGCGMKGWGPWGVEHPGGRYHHLHHPARLPAVRCHQPRGAAVEGPSRRAVAKGWGVGGRGHSLGVSRVDGRRSGR